jgi:plastocyanin
MRPTQLISALAVTAVVLAGCGDDDSDSTTNASSQASGGSSIAIRDFKFSPSTLTVSSGAQINASNDDSTTHTVTADDGSFNTGDIGAGSSKTFSAPSPGRYAYHCEIHSFMHGTLVVR